MISVTASTGWLAAHPGATIGLLELSEVDNQVLSPALNERKRVIEARLREEYAGFTRQDFLALPILSAYARYYKRFEKTYHVLQQVESLALKGKRLPDVSPLVDANFAAEVDTLLLTAGHDADRLVEPVLMDVARDGDQITTMSGAVKSVPPGDMLMRDRQGVCCTILYGQDDRSPITAQTRRVLYVTYAPPGVPAQAVEEHMRQIEQHVRLFAPQARQEQFRLLLA